MSVSATRGTDQEVLGRLIFKKTPVIKDSTELSDLDDDAVVRAEEVKTIKNDLGDLGDEVQEIVVRVPLAPSADGVYLLQCEVVDGEPVFTWEEQAG